MKKTILTPLSVILPAMFLFLLLKTFFLDFVQVKGHSMDPSLVENEFLFINRAAFGIYVPFLNKYLISWSFPQRGDILILREPDEDKIIVKRCAGLPGDSVRVLQDTLEIGNSLIPVEYSDSVKFNGMKSIE
ncbi:MAG: signal peptidase I, partial [Spirochaetales bacterium]|nr:signal peptidase I [Spirochaetales bacterium]